MTFLRDPVERTLSHYHYIRRLPDHHLHELAATLSLSEYLRDPRTRLQTSDFQARALMCDLAPAPSARDDDEPARRRFQQEQRLELWKPEYDAAELLDRSLARLDALDFCGVTEMFAESLALLCLDLGMFPTAGGRRNETPQRSAASALDPDDLALIHEVTAVDRELWRQATQRIERRRGELPTDPHADIAPSAFGDQRCPLIPFETSLHVAAGDADRFLGEGWGDAEPGGRWTVGTVANFYFRASDRKPFRLVIRGNAFGPQTMRAEVNGRPVGETALPADRMTELFLDFPPDAIASYNVVQLALPDAVRPCDRLPDSQDARLLGFFLDSLRFE